MLASPVFESGFRCSPAAVIVVDLLNRWPQCGAPV